MSYQNITSAIQTCTITDENEFDLFVDEIIGQIDDIELSNAQKEELIGLFLAKIEDQPDPDFTSWSLIHFLDGLDEDNSTNYNDQVLQCLKRNPGYLTLLLANRIANGLPKTSPDRLNFISALKDVALNPSVEEYLRKEANALYEYQLNK